MSTYTEPPTTPKQRNNSENMIYQRDNITITNLRAVFGAKTYSIANITSVEMQKSEASGCLPIGTVLFGVCLVIFGLSNIKEHWLLAALGVVIAAAGVALMRSLKPTFIVSITTASGEIKAYDSQDRQSIEQIVSALNNAIVQKG